MLAHIHCNFLRTISKASNSSLLLTLSLISSSSPQHQHALSWALLFYPVISRQKAIQTSERLGFPLPDTIFMRSDPACLGSITCPSRMHLYTVSIIQLIFVENSNLEQDLLPWNLSTHKTLQLLPFRGLPESDFLCIDPGAKYSLIFLCHSFFLEPQQSVTIPWFVAVSFMSTDSSPIVSMMVLSSFAYLPPRLHMASHWSITLLTGTQSVQTWTFNKLIPIHAFMGKAFFFC